MTRRAALVGALAVLLALVAASSAIEPVDGGGATGGGGVPPSVAAYAYAAVTVLALAGIPALLVLAVRELPDARRRGRRTWLTALVLVCLVAVGVAVSAYDGDGLSEMLARVRVVQPSPSEQELARPPGAEWVPLALVTGLALGGGVLALRRRPAVRRPSLAECVADALDGPLDDLRDEPDVRRAVIAAFARLERALGAAGAPRAPGEAPLEFVERVLGELAVPRRPLDQLAALFERARFSLHPLGETDREAAVAALESVRATLVERG
ncbi:MAG TPA: DUF4129 domain-containing protein [Gaiellaceae bacterium]|nr:DUF4129 domain-containing protein [Gaiellaceae bacterium]